MQSAATLSPMFDATRSCPECGSWATQGARAPWSNEYTWHCPKGHRFHALSPEREQAERRRDQGAEHQLRPHEALEAATRELAAGSHTLEAAALQLFYVALLLRQHCTALTVLPQASVQKRREVDLLRAAADILERQGHEVRELVGRESSILSTAKDLIVQMRRESFQLHQKGAADCRCTERVECGDLAIEIGPDRDGLDLIQISAAERGCAPHASFTIPDAALTPLIEAIERLRVPRRP
jgi:hypothetical protein